MFRKFLPFNKKVYSISDYGIEFGNRLLQIEKLKKELDLKNQEIDRLNSENYALKEQLEWSMKEIESVAVSSKNNWSDINFWLSFLFFPFRMSS